MFRIMTLASPDDDEEDAPEEKCRCSDRADLSEGKEREKSERGSSCCCRRKQPDEAWRPSSEVLVARSSAAAILAGDDALLPIRRDVDANCTVRDASMKSAQSSSHGIVVLLLAMVRPAQQEARSGMTKTKKKRSSRS
jgi:hypothetical protein